MRWAWEIIIVDDGSSDECVLSLQNGRTLVAYQCGAQSRMVARSHVDHCERCAFLRIYVACGKPCSVSQLALPCLALPRALVYVRTCHSEP